MTGQTPNERINTLRVKCANLQQRGREFAESMIDQYDERGTLSEKQWYWVGVLIQDAEGARNDARPSVIDINGAELVAFMDRASAAGLKYPKVKLTCNGEPLVISRAGDRSQAPGSLVVTDGGPYGDNVFYGRIARDGTFTHNPRTCTDDVVKVLRALATKPAETAAAYGQRTGQCCFCRRHLEDYRSVTVGYGPICADKYGLPWGEVEPDLSKYSEAEMRDVSDVEPQHLPS